MIAAVVNAVVVILGGLLGLLFGGKLKEVHTETIVNALGICTMVIGITSAITTSNILIVIICLVIGTILGELLKIEHRLDTLGDWLKSKVSKNGGGRFTEGFVTASLLFCVGSMAIMGSFDAGLRGDYNTIFAKSALDCVMAVTFAATMGVGNGNERRGRYHAHRYGHEHSEPDAEADPGRQYAASHHSAGPLVCDCGNVLTNLKKYISIQLQFLQFSCII